MKVLKAGEEELALVDGLHMCQLRDLGKWQPVPAAWCPPTYTDGTAGPQGQT